MIFVGENLQFVEKRFGQVCGNSGKNPSLHQILLAPTLMCVTTRVEDEQNILIH